MRKLLHKLTALALAAVLCLPAAYAADWRDGGEQVVQVGLAFQSGALAAAHLENNSGYGAGYRLGYFDDDLEFVELGCTSKKVTQLTMLRTSQMYRTSAGYTKDKPGGNYTTIGCYHVVLDEFDDFEEALEASEDYKNSFVAWIDGDYQLRQGTYETKEEAKAACEELEGLDVKGTSAYAVNVFQTGKTTPLFQFDGGEEVQLGIMPDVTDAEDVRTWFKGYRYRGGFRYERIKGGDLTVVNIVDMETYTKGVIPYEMSNDWPLEALKAQAVCARSYAYNCIQQHSHLSHNFDICTTECCQVYRGVGSNVEKYQANERTDRAVEETEGLYALYDGDPIWAYYSSSHGGASERIDNVWASDFKKFPYLTGTIDPYEQNVARLNSYSYWIKTWSKDDLTQRLRDRGYAQNTRVESLDLTYSPRGNAISVQVNYENGKYNTFTPKMSWGLKSLFGVSALHFTVNGLGGLPTGKEDSGEEQETTPLQIMVNQTQKLDTGKRIYVISGKGKTSRTDAEELYALTGSDDTVRIMPEGSKQEDKPVDLPTKNYTVHIDGSRYVIEGAGNGHQLGMSQYGAYAMAEAGKDFEDIVKFYYTDIEVDEL